MLGNKRDFLRVEILRQSWLAQAAIAERVTQNFDVNHGVYLKALRQRLRRIFQAPELLDALREIGVDWLTVHYQSIHPIQDWERATETDWLRLGVAADPGLEECRKDLEVYEGIKSPYIERLNRSLVEQGEPLRVFLAQSDGQLEKAKREGWLCVSKRLGQYLAETTRGKSAQGDLKPEESPRWSQLDKEGSVRIRKQLQKWLQKELSTEGALGLLRDSCRVTLLGIGAEIPAFKSDRWVTLAPVHLGDSLVGGIAFLGKTDAKRKVLPGRLETLLLASLAVSLLAGLRLREEKEGQEQKGEMAKMAALNLAREQTVQSISHALQSPLDGLEARIRKASTLFEEVRNETSKLRAAQQKLLATFSTRDLAAVLVPKPIPLSLGEFLSNQQLVNEVTFEDKGIVLEIQTPPEKCIVHFDADQLFEVFENLLNNALRYARRRVAVSVDDTSQFVVRVGIRDDGRGISEDVMPHLFEAGFSDQEDGTHGFGLYYSRELMRRNGGKLRLGSTGEHGTEFWVEMNRP